MKFFIKNINSIPKPFSVKITLLGYWVLYLVIGFIFIPLVWFLGKCPFWREDYPFRRRKFSELKSTLKEALFDRDLIYTKWIVYRDRGDDSVAIALFSSYELARQYLKYNSENYWPIYGSFGEDVSTFGLLDYAKYIKKGPTKPSVFKRLWAHLTDMLS